MNAKRVSLSFLHQLMCEVPPYVGIFHIEVQHDELCGCHHRPLVYIDMFNVATLGTVIRRVDGVERPAGDRPVLVDAALVVFQERTGGVLLCVGHWNRRPGLMLTPAFNVFGFRFPDYHRTYVINQCYNELL